MTIKHGFMVMMLVGGLALETEATEATRTFVPVDADMSCQEIYLEVEALLALKDEAAAGFWSDQKNQMAGAKTSARNCISTRISPSPSHSSQRPPGTLKEK